MRLHIIAVGHKMPDWVTNAFQEYSKRLPNNYHLNLVELSPAIRSKSTDLQRAIDDEGERMLAALPKQAWVVALDEKGKSWNSKELAKSLSNWQQDGRDVALLIGGADGLASAVKARADQTWSLSALTLPHGMVRVVLAEQLYRAWSLLNNHPYHRT